MLADTPLPRGFGAALASVDTFFPRAPEQFVTSPLRLVGYVRWDARSDRVPPLQTIIFSSFTGRTKGSRRSVHFETSAFSSARKRTRILRRRRKRIAKRLTCFEVWQQRCCVIPSNSLQTGCRRPEISHAFCGHRNRHKRRVAAKQYLRCGDELHQRGRR